MDGNHIRRALKWLSLGLVSITSGNRTVTDNPVRLLPLTPKFDPDQHQIYADLIEDALKSKAIKNIALSGGYGVGKSSILQDISINHQRTLIQISLSSLGLQDEKAHSESDTQIANPEQSITNRIQKEIVKQLLYREKPGKMPGSRFRRIERFSPHRGAGIALLIGLVLSLAAYLTGWTSDIAQLWQSHDDVSLRTHIFLFLAITAFVYLVEWLIHNRVRIESLTAGSATISLATKSETYFDEYLDEIVHFFEVTKHDIVVFEDIDRFDDPHIFEALRSLNTLLNSARQLKGRTIRFIYAIKDSIFEELGSLPVAGVDEANVDKPEHHSITELAANRTKFFDIVVPVVPFITHRNAGDLMSQLVDAIGRKVSMNLINLAAPYLADMRLMTNICNEFQIFCHVLLESEQSLNLDESSLFAMTIYKNLHLTDFEAIKSKSSSIDQVYSDFRQMVNTHVAELNAHVVATHRQLNNLDTIDSRREALGTSLRVFLGILCRSVGYPNQAPLSITFGNSTWTVDSIQSADFWQEAISTDAALTITMNPYGGNPYPRSMTISRADLREIVSDSLEVDEWLNVDRQRLLKKQQELIDAIHLLKSADMSFLWQHREYTLEDQTFEDRVRDKLPSELAANLIREGQIDRNFALYTSNFYAKRLSNAAQNFIIHHVEPNQPDPHYILDSNDVETILQEHHDILLRDQSVYNISIVDHLLKVADQRSDQLVKRLSQLGSAEQEFLGIYLAGGSQQIALARYLSRTWEGVFQFFISRADLAISDKTAYINSALEASVDSIDYVVDVALSNFIVQHYEQLPVYTSSLSDQLLAERVVKLVVRGDNKLPSLASLGPQVQIAAIENRCFEITVENLKTALDGSEGFALDQIRTFDSNIYGYLLEDLPSYIRTIQNLTTPTIQSPEAFPKVIAEVVAKAPTLLDEIVDGAESSCQVSRLELVPNEAWPALASSRRFPTSFHNVRSYVSFAGLIDDRLGAHLAYRGQILEVNNAPEEEKASLALHILGADTLNAALSIKLIRSLKMTEPLAASEIQAESGKLLGWMIQHKIIADDAQSYELTLQTDWDTREFAISKSKNFLAFVIPELIPVGDVALLIKSKIIPVHVKCAIVERVADFLSASDYAELAAVAEFAEQTKTQLTVEQIKLLAEAQVDSDRVVRLLEPLLPEASESELVEVLVGLGGPYAKLSERKGAKPRIPDTASNRALVLRLEYLDLVNSHRIKEEDGEIVAFMKKSDLA